MDDVGTPRQRDIRISPNHDAVPRKSKTVQTTNGVICTKEGVYYLCASSTDEMCMLIRGFLLKNHLLENRNLVCFSDGAKTIWSNYDKWFKCFSKRRLFVDWHHLVKKSNELFTRILKSDKKYEKEIIEIKRIYFGILWSGNILGARDYLWEIPSKYIKAGRSVDLLADYLQSKMDHHSIACFAVRKQLKQINASSRAETANCSMTTSRQKKQGKSWSEDGSHAKTNWRNVYANNEAANIVNGRPLRLSLKNDVDRHRAINGVNPVRLRMNYPLRKTDQSWSNRFHNTIHKSHPRICASINSKTISITLSYTFSPTTIRPIRSNGRFHLVDLERQNIHDCSYTAETIHTCKTSHQAVCMKFS